MFLTDKYHALLPIHSAKGHRKPAAAPGVVSRFDAALAARLASLLPLPASPLAALARLADLLAATLADAVPALSSAASADTAAVAAHLDAGVALLDACNAIAARVDRLRRRRLLSRLALHLLSSSPSSAQRARAALADHGGAPSPPVPLPSVPFANPPRGAGRQLTPTARVLLAVNAVSSLAAAAAATILASDSSNPNPASLTPLVLSSDLPWAEPFNALSTQLALLAAAKTSEVDAVDEAVRKLASALDTTADEASVLAAAQEVEKRTEELAALLDRLSDAVNGVFRAALRLRAAELGSFAVGPADKTRKK
ncbi:uncharacterized protein LOC124678816 [Lolium rigidum]|uniref:uncharacterized protein LOC124678816 n=1 Tax=Lolium rigidum TaxID=89674 RepID=UPI001F5C73BD|nr:uncharacterized protein LOC124678816 [Lolium rigidum]